MSPRKLTDSDKKEILELYRTPQETTSTLAERYEVSSSTISRFLKSHLPDNEYEELIQQKRLSRTPSGAAQVMSQFQQQGDDEPKDASGEPAPSIRRTRRRSSAPEESPPEKPRPSKPTLPQGSAKRPMKKKEEEYFEDEDDETDVHALEEMLGEDLGDLDEDEDEDEDDFDEDEEDWEDDLPPQPRGSAQIQVLPLSDAMLPRTCYLVVDRAAELIAPPLKEFGDLGTIPAEEVQQKTLPVFDNHRVARRFSKRSQRVIKVPDSRMLEKTGSCLRSKGITRLLINGQVYALSLN